MSERPRVLSELGVELDRVARTVLAQGASSPGRRARRRFLRISPAVIIALVLLVAAAAATATLLFAEGSPLPAPHAGDLAPWGHPIAGSVRLAHLNAPDPAGDPPWDLRLSRSETGEICTAVGQVYDGKFGIIGLDHVFRELPVGGG